MLALAIGNTLTQAILVPAVVKSTVAAILRLVRALAMLEEDTEELASLRHAGHTVLGDVLKQLQNLSALGVN